MIIIDALRILLHVEDGAREAWANHRWATIAYLVAVTVCAVLIVRWLP